MVNQRRSFKISERIQSLLAQELIRASDPRFFMVTITSVVVSKDLRHAKVYWVVSGEKERREQVQEAFDSAAGMFRRTISKEMSIRFVPELKFFYDDTLDVTYQVEELLGKIRLENENTSE